MTDPAIEPERRQSTRRRTLKGAHIVFNQGFSTIVCIVRNISRDGAQLRVESAVGVPDAFQLVLDDGRKYECHSTWRTENNIGVEFNEASTSH